MRISSGGNSDFELREILNSVSGIAFDLFFTLYKVPKWQACGMLNRNQSAGFAIKLKLHVQAEVHEHTMEWLMVL